MTKLLRFLHTPRFVIALALLVNAGLIAIGIIFAPYVYLTISASASVIALAVMIIDSRGKFRSYAVVFATLFLPIFAITLYYYFKPLKGSSFVRRRWYNVNFKSSSVLLPNQQVIDNLVEKNNYQAKVSKYLLNSLNMPIYQNTNTKFFSECETYFDTMLEELRKAERYIFIESYLIEQGNLWDSIFEVLKIKARQGVEIKILYDDSGSEDSFQDKKTFIKLANYKIDARPFNKMHFVQSSIECYRDHRKMVIIDGKVAFTGGLDISDACVNYRQVYGAWKDGGIMLSGDAVWSMAVMFINSWQFTTKQDLDMTKYKATIVNRRSKDEWVQPFGTSPFFEGRVSKNVYLSVIQNANKTIYITAPTFVIDEEMMSTLIMASRSGVDVKIIFPSVSNKKSKFYTARESFGQLIRAGVKVFEYTAGYIHDKGMVVDGETAIVGNITWDFRPLHNRFENGVLIHGGNTVQEIKFSFERTLNSCRMLTMKDYRSRKWTEKLCAKILRFISPIF